MGENAPQYQDDVVDALNNALAALTMRVTQERQAEIANEGEQSRVYSSCHPIGKNRVWKRQKSYSEKSKPTKKPKPDGAV